jgi:prepilin signal peptidase PulO-like enzyme (type II secretory pathway)
MSCGKPLSWFELIPVVSYLFLKGRCSGCKAEVSFQYPVVEWGTAILFFVSYLAVFSNKTNGLATLLFLWIQIALFIVISGYDLRHKIIPDGPLFVLAVVAVVKTITLGIDASYLLMVSTLGWQFLTAGVLFIPFYLLWRVSKGRWMGYGDGKIAFVIGLLLPGIAGLSAVLVAFYIGAAVAVSIIVAQKTQCVLSGKVKMSPLSMNSEIPFGPFLALGTILVGLYTVGAVWLLPFLPLLGM